MRKTRLARGLLLAGLLLFSTGCEYFLGAAAVGAVGGVVASRDIRVKPGASVRVDLAQPRDVAALRIEGAAGDTIWLRETRQLFGRVQRTAGDSVWLGISQANGAAGVSRYPLGGMPVVLVRPEPGVRIEPLANRPAYMVMGALVGMGISVLALFVFCAVETCWA